jgi:succinate dehydrogenase / fumarate reductase flavoprotein subunit
MRGGKLLNHWRMAELHAKEAPERVWELEQWGALFDRTPEGLISQRDFGGHRYARLAHVGDRTGLEMIRTLQQRAVSLGIDVFMECTVTDLLRERGSPSDPTSRERGSRDPTSRERGSPSDPTSRERGSPSDPTSRERGSPSDPGDPSDPAGAGGRIAGAFAYWRESGRFVVFEAPAVILATGGIGKSWRVTSNSWEYTGDGHALALRAGATLVNMEFVQFHPTGMVWPPSVWGILVTESVRGDGGVLRNSEGRRFMFDYIPEFFKAETADSEDEADRWYTDKRNNRRPPELLPRDEVARAINTEIKEGRGTPHGGVFLDIASRRNAEYIQKRLPSMYHQFKELADVDITAEPMEIGPTCHYVMGGVEVDPDTAASRVTGLYAAGEVAGGMHGSNRLGGNSLSDLLVFGKRAGEAAAAYANALAGGRPGVSRPMVSDADVAAAAAAALAPFKGGTAGGAGAGGSAASGSAASGSAAAGSGAGGENPYALQLALQEVMQELVGIVRTESEIERALTEIAAVKARMADMTVEGHRQYNPGWHLSLDLPNMVLVSEAVARAALERQESRGGHTRDDFPMADDFWSKLNVIVAFEDGKVTVRRQALPVPPPELAELLEEQH